MNLYPYGLPVDIFGLPVKEKPNKRHSQYAENVNSQSRDSYQLALQLLSVCFASNRELKMKDFHAHTLFFFCLRLAFLSFAVIHFISSDFFHDASSSPPLPFHHFFFFFFYTPPSPAAQDPRSDPALSFSLSHASPPSSSSASSAALRRPSQAMLTLLSGWLIARRIAVNSLAND